MPYTFTQLVSIVILCALFLVMYRRESLLQRPHHVFWPILGIVIASLGVTTYFQWQTFASSEPARFLLPPYAPWTYFIRYSWSWIWSQYILALGGSLLIGACIRVAPQSWRDARFTEGEPLLIVSGLLLVGHPYWLFYGAGVLLLYCIYVAIRAWRDPVRIRISFYPFWIPSALIVVLLTPFLKNLSLMQALSITLS